MGENNSFILYKDSARLFEKLSDEDAGQLIKAIFHYVTTKEEPVGLSDAADMAFICIHNYLLRDAEKWAKKKERLAENGKRGGRPRKEEASEENQMVSEKSNWFLKKQLVSEKPNGFQKNQLVLKKPNGLKKSLSVSVSVNDSVSDSASVSASVKDTSPLTPLKRGECGGGSNEEISLLKEPIPDVSCPTEKLRELWNAECVSLSPIRGINGKREKMLRSRWKEHPDLDWWMNFFQQIKSSDFLCGRSTNWSANFDWVINAANVDKILEGRYDNKHSDRDATRKEAAIDESEQHRYDGDYWQRGISQGNEISNNSSTT